MVRYELNDTPEITSWLPLTPAVFHILLALSDGTEHHGYALMQEIGANGGPHVGPGTLYGAIKRLLEGGLIIEAEAEIGEERRRYYRITPLGLRIAEAEAQRLDELVSAARAKRLLRQEGTV